MIDLSGPELTADERAFLAEHRPGGLCLFSRNVVDRFQVAELIAEVRSLCGPELLVTVDQEGGGVVRLPDLPYPPSAMALGAANDVGLTRAVAAATGQGLRSVGIDVDLAPVADVNSNPANPVIADRAFGADPQHVAAHVVAFVQGLQAAGVAATVKHFPGHGDAAVDSHLALPTLDLTLSELQEREWPPFVAAFAAGVDAVMTAHIVIPSLDPDLPATLSPTIITGLLRERLGFKGVVFSDALEMKAIGDRWGGAEAAVLALAAGVDMPAQVASLAVHEQTVQAVQRATRDGRLDPAALAAAAARLAELKERYRGAGEPSPVDPDRFAEVLDDASRRALVRVGELPPLDAGGRVVLVAARATRQSAATQATVSPAAGLAVALRVRGVSVQEVPYDPQEALSVADEALAAGAAGDLLIFASTARTRLTPEETGLAGRLAAETPRSFLHVALWNPYLVADVPGPALVSFGWRERSLAAVAAALLGEAAVTATAPIELRSA